MRFTFDILDLYSSELPQKGDILTFNGISIGVVENIDYEERTLNVCVLGRCRITVPPRFVEIGKLMVIDGSMKYRLPPNQ